MKLQTIENRIEKFLEKLELKGADTTMVVIEQKNDSDMLVVALTLNHTTQVFFTFTLTIKNTSQSVKPW